MQFPIRIGLHRSRFCDLGLLASAVLASLAMLASPLSAPHQFTLVALGWIGFAFARHAMKPSFSALRLEHDGKIRGNTSGDDSRSVSLELLPDATVHPWLTVFRLKSDDGRTYTIIAAVDSLSATDFRRLRVFLRWRADFSAQTGDADE